MKDRYSMYFMKMLNMDFFCGKLAFFIIKFYICDILFMISRF